MILVLVLSLPTSAYLTFLSYRTGVRDTQTFIIFGLLGIGRGANSSAGSRLCSRSLLGQRRMVPVLLLASVRSVLAVSWCPCWVFGRVVGCWLPRQHLLAILQANMLV